MYKIIGADGKEYGPVSLEQLQQWLNEGRLNHESKVLVVGESTWKSLRDVPELAPLLQPGAPAPFPAHSDNAAGMRQRVRGPATFILVLSILNLLTCLWGLLFGDVEAQLAVISKIAPEYVDFLRRMSFLFGVPAHIFGLTTATICLLGARQMMKLRSYGLTLVTAIIMLIPCSTCCCCLNLGAGIWALVVLLKPEVKSAFR